METKICRICGIEKDLSLFPYNKPTGTSFKNRSGYYKPYCKECTAKKAKEYRDSRPGLWKKYKEDVKNKKGKFSKYSIEDKYLISAIRTRIIEAKSNNKRYPNRPFNIDADYMYNIWKLQNGKCYLTGVPLSLDKQQPNSLSIDKIYPELGYTKGNVRWASWAANRAKGDLTFEVFHSMCQRILEKCNDYRKEDGTYQIPIFLS